MPAGLRGAIARAIPDRAALALTARLELRGIDWATTPAFAHPADNQGYVRLNLRGRERGGVVAPEAAEGLMEEIAAGLADLPGPRRSARRGLGGASGELYRGRHADRLPDLVVRWSDRPATGLTELRSGALRDGASPRERLRALRQPHAGRRLGAGAPGRATHVVPARPPRLVDVAATICELTGADPAGLPGEPLLVGPGDAARARTPSQLQLRLAWVADQARLHDRVRAEAVRLAAPVCEQMDRAPAARAERRR